MRPTTRSSTARRGTDAVWFYDQPYPAVAQIKDHVAFYTDRVELTVNGTDTPEA